MAVYNLPRPRVEAAGKCASKGTRRSKNRGKNAVYLLPTCMKHEKQGGKRKAISLSTSRGSRPSDTSIKIKQTKLRSDKRWVGEL